MKYRQNRLSVLYVGNEAKVGHATSEILRKHNYAVKVSTPMRADTVIRAGHFDTLILCATLSLEEAGAVVASFVREHPGIPIISIRLGSLGEGPHPASAIVVDGLNGPDALLCAIRAVTAEEARAGD